MVNRTSSPPQEGGVTQVVFAGEGEQRQTAESMLPKDGVDLVLRTMRPPRSPSGDSMIGLHSPILPYPPAARMTGPPDGYD